jgi:hypothetical protein
MLHVQSLLVLEHKIARDPANLLLFSRHLQDGLKQPGNGSRIRLSFLIGLPELVFSNVVEILLICQLHCVAMHSTRIIPPSHR